jgi:SAM-dependent methyltransferase
VYEYTGLEPDCAAFAVAERRFTRARRRTVLNGGLECLEPTQRFDLVCAFEVLEHIADPVAVLAAWRSHVAPDRWLLVTVPAGDARMGAADRRVGHFRRYDREGLEADLTAAGLSVISIEHFGFPLGYVLRSGRNIIASVHRDASSQTERSGSSGRWLQPPDRLAWATRATTAPFRKLEATWRPAKLGTSLLGLAENKARHGLAGHS